MKTLSINQKEKEIFLRNLSHLPPEEFKQFVQNSIKKNIQKGIQVDELLVEAQREVDMNRDSNNLRKKYDRERLDDLNRRLADLTTKGGKKNTRKNKKKKSRKNRRFTKMSYGMK
jgi:hypothetical protein